MGLVRHSGRDKAPLIYCLRSACHNAFAPTCLGFLVGRGFRDSNWNSTAPTDRRLPSYSNLGAFASTGANTSGTMFPMVTDSGPAIRTVTWPGQVTDVGSCPY